MMYGKRARRNIDQRLQYRNRTRIVLNGMDAARPLEKQCPRKPARARANLDDIQTVQLAVKARNVACEIEIEKEVLP